MLLTVLGIILLVFALFLIVSVLMQHGKAKNMSGTIAGGAETFFGKTKGSTIDKMLSKITTVVAIVFTVLVVVVYVMQDTATDQYLSFKDALEAGENTPAVTTDAGSDEADAADTTAAVDTTEDTTAA